MSQLNVLDMNNKVVGKVSLKEDIFNSEVKEHLLHKSVIAHLANLRRGTHSTKNKSQVRGGGAKPWRQKGTGRARAGAIRSPLWRDRKSTRLNSSHSSISYAVFCLKK